MVAMVALALSLAWVLLPLQVAAMPVDQADPAPPASHNAGLAQVGRALAAPASAEPDQAPQDALPVCTLAPGDNTRLAVEPCRTAPQKQAGRRRAVLQNIEPMLQQSPAPHYVYHPGAPPLALPAPASSTAPSPQNGCDAGGCRDAAGARYNGGVGNAVIGPDGKVCNRNGAWLQCF